jgi:exopolyphosphatase / guanosine-5'-triphosphate,3'-diphosphate pyrophosphatase
LKKNFLIQFAGQKVGVIDIGSNTVKLEIFTVLQTGELESVFEFKDSLRLGAELNSQNEISSEAIDKLCNTIEKILQLSKSFACPIKAVGTFSLREAKNAQEICARVLKKTGCEINIVPGKEEARLVYLGALNGMKEAFSNILLIDVGGGSTEFLIAHKGEEKFSTSLKIGSVKLNQDFIVNPETEGLKKSEKILELEQYLTARIKPVADDILKIGFDFVVASSGTMKALMCVSQHEKIGSKKLHNQRISQKEIEIASEKIKNYFLEDRLKELKFIDSKRQDIILSGSAILTEVGRALEIKEWKFSRYGLREGIAIDYFERLYSWQMENHLDVRWLSVKKFSEFCLVDAPHAWRVADVCQRLYECFVPLVPNMLMPPEFKAYLRSAALLHECGKLLSQAKFNLHSAYFVAHSNLPGFSLQELAIIAFIIHYQRNELPEKFSKLESNYQLMSQKDFECAKICIASLRLAVILEKGRFGAVKTMAFDSCTPPVLIVSSRLKKTESFGEHYELRIGLDKILKLLGFSFFVKILLNNEEFIAE